MCAKKIYVCIDCGKEITRYKGAERCRECYFKSLRAEYIVCPLCNNEKHRTEFKLKNGKYRRDSRYIADGCNDCRDARKPKKKETRVCKCCSLEKLLDAFEHSAQMCTQCKQDKELRRQEELAEKAERAKLYKLEAEQRIKEADELFNMGYKICSKCMEQKELDRFSSNKNSRDGKQSWCLVCMSTNRLQWAKDNPERDRELKENFKKTEKYKIGKKNNKYERRQKLNKTPKELRLTAAQWKEVLSIYGNKCLCCGSTENITIDHIKPLSHGGLNTISNVQPLCHQCNSNKRDTEIDYRYDLSEFVV